MKALPEGGATLFGKGRWNVTCLSYKAYEITSKIYFFWRGLIRIGMDKYVFPWQMCFIWGGGSLISHVAFR
jgi:hypothetical protein